MSVSIDSVAGNGSGEMGPAAALENLLPLGCVVVTRAVHEDLMSEGPGWAFVMSCLQRHARGDWGELDPLDAAANEAATRSGARILSSYPIPPQVAAAGSGTRDDRVWVITEATDGSGRRQQTTVLYPSDY